MKQITFVLTISLLMVASALASSNNPSRTVAHAAALVSNCPERFQYLPGMEKVAKAFAKSHQSDVAGWLATEKEEIHRSPSSGDDDQDIVNTCTKEAGMWNPEAASATLNGRSLVKDRGVDVYKSLIEKIRAKKSQL